MNRQPRPTRRAAPLFALIAVMTLSSCATLVEDHKRSLLNRKCQERIVRLASTAKLPLRIETDVTATQFCSCFTQRVDINQLETDFDRVPRPGLNAETLRFVAIYLPELSECAAETPGAKL